MIIIGIILIILFYLFFGIFFGFICNKRCNQNFVRDFEPIVSGAFVFWPFYLVFLMAEKFYKEFGKDAFNVR